MWGCRVREQHDRKTKKKNRKHGAKSVPLRGGRKGAQAQLVGERNGWWCVFELERARG